MTPAIRSQIYVPYVRELRAAMRSVRRGGGTVPSVDNLLYDLSKWRSIRWMLRHRSLLVVTDSFAL